MVCYGSSREGDQRMNSGKLVPRAALVERRIRSRDLVFQLWR